MFLVVLLDEVVCLELVLLKDGVAHAILCQALVPRHPGLLDFEEHFVDSVTDRVDVPRQGQAFQGGPEALCTLCSSFSPDG
jgi:hypothetical protein